MSSTAVPELSNELALSELQSNDAPVGSLAQTHALSSLPVYDKFGDGKTILRSTQSAVDLYDSFSLLLINLKNVAVKGNSDEYEAHLVDEVNAYLDNSNRPWVHKIEQAYTMQDDDNADHEQIFKAHISDLNRANAKAQGQAAAAVIQQLIQKYRTSAYQDTPEGTFLHDRPYTKNYHKFKNADWTPVKKDAKRLLDAMYLVRKAAEIDARAFPGIAIIETDEDQNVKQIGGNKSLESAKAAKMQKDSMPSGGKGKGKGGKK